MTIWFMRASETDLWASTQASQRSHDVTPQVAVGPKDGDGAGELHDFVLSIELSLQAAPASPSAVVEPI